MKYIFNLVGLSVLIFSLSATANEKPQAVVCQMENSYSFAEGTGGVSVSFDGSCSYDPDQEAVWNPETQEFEFQGMTYKWIFPVGVVEDNFYTYMEGKKVTAKFISPGFHRVTLWIKDNEGEDAIANIDILISEHVTVDIPDRTEGDLIVNFDPIVDIGGPYVALLNEDVAFTGSAIDPDEYYGVPQYLQYGWSYADDCTFKEFHRFRLNPDGSVANNEQGDVIFYDGDGRVDFSINSATWLYEYNVVAGTNCISTGQTPSHRFTSPGLKQIELMVVDKYYPLGEFVGNGYYNPGIGVASTTVLVNQKPTAVIAAPEIALVNQQAAFSAANSSDPDGNLLSFVWDFGDGATGSGREVVHEYTEPGIYQVSAIASDGYHSSDPVSSTVEVRDLSWLVPVLSILL